MRTRPICLAALWAATLGAGPTTTTTAPSPRRPAGEYQTFDLRLVGEPTPPLRYRLTVDAADRIPGNAAVDYLKAVSLLPADTEAVVDRALDDHAAGNSLATDKALADLLDRAKPAIDQMVVASRRASCDWNDAGWSALSELLPRLGRMRQLAQLLRATAIWYGDRLQTPEAVGVVRAEYALAANVAAGQPMIGGLVGLGIEAIAHESAADAMGRRDAVNLYWPLRTMRRPLIGLSDVMAGERQWISAQMPSLKKGRADDVAPNDWADLVGQMQGRTATSGTRTPAAAGIGMLPAELVKRARDYYADTRHVTPAVAAAVSVDELYSIYQLEQFHTVQDEMEKAAALPLAEALPAFDALPAKLAGMKIDPANLAMLTVPSMRRTVLTFARVDRALAALTAVESIRTYATGHDGTLPPSLADVVETPAPANPVTGRPFDYRLDGETATLSDETSAVAKDVKLAYTIRVRKR